MLVSRVKAAILRPLSDPKWISFLKKKIPCLVYLSYLRRLIFEIFSTYKWNFCQVYTRILFRSLNGQYTTWNFNFVNQNFNHDKNTNNIIMSSLVWCRLKHLHSKKRTFKKTYITTNHHQPFQRYHEITK